MSVVYLFQTRLEQAEEQIEALEMNLLGPDILLFRHLAGRALKRQSSAQGSNSSLRSQASSASSKRASLDLTASEDTAKDQVSPGEERLKDQPKESSSPHASGSRSECNRSCVPKHVLLPL